MHRLLIADDELIERTVLYKTINKYMSNVCEVFQAANGRQALQIFKEKKIQIAILDIEMPGINGIETAWEMRRQDPDCIIIFLTAFDEFSYAKQAIVIRALDYLLKPYNETELISIVEEALRQISLKKEPRITTERQLEKIDAEDIERIRIEVVKEKMQQYIERNYSLEISMQDAANYLNYSDAYFCKLFKRCFHKNFTSYLTEYRIGEAKKLLEKPNENIKDIGEAVGYGDSNYFTKVFKRITGVSPTEYRIYIFNQKQESRL